jgi:TIR domain
MRDVFISYSSKDAVWVREVLLPRLEHHGFSVTIDFRDFKAGSSSVQEIEHAVEHNRRTILVLSDHYIQSEWTKFENVMAQTLDPGAAQRRMIPILRGNCDIPLRFRILVYRDFRNEDDKQWDLLMRDLT